MLFDFGAGEYVGADGAHLAHCWVEVVRFVGGPAATLQERWLAPQAHSSPTYLVTRSFPG